MNTSPLRRIPGLLRLVALFVIITAALPGVASAQSSGAAAPQLAASEFTLVGDENAPFSWGSYLEVSLGGDVKPDWLEAKRWTATLNGVPVRISRVYPGAERHKLRFALVRPTAAEGSPLDGLAIEALTNSRFGAARADLALTFDKQPLKTAPAGRGFVKFELVGRYRLWTFLVLIALVAGGIWYTAEKTGVVRDSNPKLPWDQRPFSLAKVQLALWMVIIGASYVLLHLFTGQFNGLLNGTALALLGISTLTTMASAAVENPPPAAPQQHVDFITDIVSDSNGANLHRLQMVMWTLVLAVIYLWQMWTDLKLPDFDGETFGLMGISASTYVWFKKKE